VKFKFCLNLFNWFVPSAMIIWHMRETICIFPLISLLLKKVGRNKCLETKTQTRPKKFRYSCFVGCRFLLNKKRRGRKLYFFLQVLWRENGLNWIAGAIQLFVFNFYYWLSIGVKADTSKVRVVHDTKFIIFILVSRRFRKTAKSDY
jgi:hypothetical protein